MDALPLKDFNFVMTTENPSNKMKFQWSIRNINKLPGLIRTSKFSLAPGQPCDWDISIRQGTDNTFQFILAYHAQRNAVPILVRSFSRILKSNGSVLEHRHQNTHLFNGGDHHLLFSRLKFTDEEGDKIVLQCSMTVHGYGLVCSRNPYNDDQDVAELRRDYLKMMTGNEFADVEISVADQCFAAHRCILKHLAPLFFRKHLKDNLEGKISLMDMAPYLFESVLKGIYSGVVNLTAIAMDFEQFYSVASSYDLRILLRKSIEEMVYDIRTDNVCKFYRMAESKRDDALLEYCKAFMKDNLSALQSNADYLELSVSRPHLPRTTSRNKENVEPLVVC